MAGYLIVTFDNESSVTIVPTSWVKEEGGVKLCFWPRCSPIKLNYLVKKNEPPSTAWDLVKVCVMKYADTYEKALEYEEKAMYTSDIATDARPDCEEGEKKKKKKINKRQKSQMHEFSSEEESSSILPDFPQINKRSSVNKSTPIPAQKKSLRTENSIYIASPSSLDYSPIHPSAAVPSLSSFCPPIHQSAAVSTASSSCPSIHPSAAVSTPSSSCPPIHPSAAVSKNPLPQLPLSCPKLPCQDPEDLSDLEKVLQDGAVFASICDYLTTIGGNSVKDTTRRVLTQIISNKLSLKYNWKGTRGVKLAFGSFTSITKLVLGAVRNNPASSTATDFQVNNIIKQWLMHAKDRDNGRNERAKN